MILNNKLIRSIVIASVCCFSSGFTVLVDPGHGGRDPGTSAHSGLQEKSISLMFSQDLHKALQKYQRVNVLMTRQDDSTCNLTCRGALIATTQPDFIISIHMDKAYIPRLQGVTIYIQDEASRRSPLRYKWQKQFFDRALGGLDDTLVKETMQDIMMDSTLLHSEELAYAILRELASVVPLYHRRPQAKSLYMLRPAVPTVLIELGFIDNVHDILRMTDTPKRQQIAHKMAYAIIQYAQQQGLYNPDGELVDKH